MQHQEQQNQQKTDQTTTEVKSQLYYQGNNSQPEKSKDQLPLNILVEKTNDKKVSKVDQDKDSKTMLSSSRLSDSNISFLSSSDHNDNQTLDDKLNKQSNNLSYGQPVETQFSIFKLKSQDNFDLSQQSRISQLSCMYDNLNTNLSFLNNLKTTQLQNFEQVNQEGENQKIFQNDICDQEFKISQNPSQKSWLVQNDSMQESCYDEKQDNNFCGSTQCEKSDSKFTQNHDNSQNSFKKKLNQKNQKDNNFQNSKKKNKKNEKRKKNFHCQNLKYKNKEKNNQKQKYINFVFDNISLDVYFHLNKAYLNKIEADMVFKQNPNCLKPPKYKHQETLYIECQLILKKNIFGKKKLNCKIFRRNKYICKAVVNNNVYYRNERVNYLKKMDKLFCDFFKMSFQIQNFQITLSFNNFTVLITELDNFALSKGILKTKNQYIGEFEQQNFFDKTVLKVASLYQQQILDHCQYFVSKYFVYDITFDRMGQMYIDSSIVKGYAKQILG